LKGIDGMSTKVKRKQTLGEEIANAISHGVGALLSIAGTTVAIVMAAIMAFTRLYVFVHFPTDIYGGIIVAAGIAYFVYRMEKIITPRIQKLINKKA
jgi:membrane-associated phospholipid phosphatase